MVAAALVDRSVFFYFLTRYMRPEGPSRAAADFLPIRDRSSCPQPLWVILGHPFSYYPNPPNKGKDKVNKRKESSLGRARPALLAL